MPYHNTTNSRAFNNAFNQFAGTEGVEYAHDFPMDVYDGAQYLARNRASVGRQYATQVLEDKVGSHGSFVGDLQHDDMTRRQRAVLSYMRSTTDDQMFDSALHAAIEFGALPHSARHVFGQGYARPPAFMNSFKSSTLSANAAAPVQSDVAPVQSAIALANDTDTNAVPLQSNAAMSDVDEVQNVASTPNRVVLNAGTALGRSTPLHQKAKRARKSK